MKRSDKLFLESLLYRFNALLPIYSALDLMPVSSVHHKEHDHILNNFSDPALIIAEKYILRIHLLQKISSNKFHLLTIDDSVSYSKLNKGTINQDISDMMRVDYSLPSPLNQRLILAESLTGELEIYTKVAKGKVTKGAFPLNENLPDDSIETFVVIRDFLNRLGVQEQ